MLVDSLDVFSACFAGTDDTQAFLNDVDRQFKGVRQKLSHSNSVEGNGVGEMRERERSDDGQACKGALGKSRYEKNNRNCVRYVFASMACCAGSIKISAKFAHHGLTKRHDISAVGYPRSKQEEK